MRATALLLLILAIALAWPVPLALARARWPRSHPRAAIVLWQAVGIAGGLSLVGCLVEFGLAPLGPGFTHASSRLARSVLHGDLPTDLGPVDLILLAAALILLIRLLGVLLVTAVRTERDLRRQRRAVDLVADPVATADPRDHLRLLQHPSPAAYCLPGARPRIVITEGTVAALSPDELEAVLAHERAHARGRHELVVQPFVAWESALPILPARRATEAVTALVEMLADDTAAARTSSPSLARALATIGGTSSPVTPPSRKGTADPAPTPMPTLVRVQRLTRRSTTPPRPAPTLVDVAAWAGAIVLVAGPTWLVFR